jgi:signal transduction histidine kinase/ActR/RegA family two-component response regulator
VSEDAPTGLLERLRAWLIHPEIQADPVALTQAQVALFVSGPGTVAGLALMGLSSLANPASTQVMLSLAVLLGIVGASSIFLRWHRTRHLTAFIQIGLNTVLLMVATYWCGGLNSAGLVFFPAMPILAMMMRGTWAMVLCTATLCMYAVWLLHLEQTGYVLPLAVEPSNELLLPVLIWVMVSASVAIWYFRHKLSSAIATQRVEMTRRQAFEDELHQTEHALREAKMRAEQANEAKGTFLAQVSHEIRNPLTAIIGAIDLLELTSDENARTARLDLMRRSASTLSELVTDILDFSRIEAGELAISPIACDPVSLVEMIEMIYRAEAIERGVDLLLAIGPEVPRAALLDPIRTEQVLRNLVSNALKFTPEGHISIELQLRDGELIFGIVDSGIGIPESAQDRIFVPFVQAEQSTTSAYSGAGLGLPICSRIVALMGGEIGLQSTPGEGTRVWFSLPLVAAQDGVGSPTEPPQVPTRTGRVVVVEDNEANRQVLSELLSSLGMTVRSAPDGAQGVELVQQIRPDMVFMDIRMPGIDGMEATRRIRSAEAAEGQEQVPIIALTADVEIGRVAAYGEAGMNDLQAKPVTRAQLAQLLESWLPATVPRSRVT